MGDPAGVGPEIIVKAWALLRDRGPAFVAIGDFDLLTSAPGAGGLELQRVASPADAASLFEHALPVLDVPLNAAVVAGRASPSHAAAVIRWIETGAGLALSGAVAGLVTAPIAKAPLYEAGFQFPGHTEYLGDLTRTANQTGPQGPVMMLCAGDLRTALVTIHEPLSAVPGLLSIESIVRAGLVTAQALRDDFGIANPRMAVAALNPHAGEGGALGGEEDSIIRPACVELRRLGVDCTDPKPADSLFHPEARRGYDAVLCMYHDQALIPVKMLDFWGGVNVTLGLPIVRTSPDHGVAFDIAGRGLAKPQSLVAALELAASIAAHRGRGNGAAA